MSEKVVTSRVSGVAAARFVVPSKTADTGCCKRKIGFIEFSDAFRHAEFLANKRMIPQKKMWVYCCKGKTGRFHVGNRWLEVPVNVLVLMRQIARLQHDNNRLRKQTGEAK